MSTLSGLPNIKTKTKVRVKRIIRRYLGRRNQRSTKQSSFLSKLGIGERTRKTTGCRTLKVYCPLARNTSETPVSSFDSVSNV